jgi:hypothetical protein
MPHVHCGGLRQPAFNFFNLYCKSSQHMSMSFRIIVTRSPSILSNVSDLLILYPSYDFLKFRSFISAQLTSLHVSLFLKPKFSLSAVNSGVFWINILRARQKTK